MTHDKHVDFTRVGSSSSPADRRINHNSSSHGDDRHGADRRPGNDKKLSSSKSSRKDKPDVSTHALWNQSGLKRELAWREPVFFSRKSDHKVRVYWFVLKKFRKFEKDSLENYSLILSVLFYLK